MQARTLERKAYLVNEYTELTQPGARVSGVSDVGDGGVRGRRFSLDTKRLITIEHTDELISIGNS